MKRTEVVVMGFGGVGREVLKCFADEHRSAAAAIDGVNIDLMAIADKSGVVHFNPGGASIEQISPLINLKEMGGSLDGIPIEDLKGLNGGHKCIVADLTGSLYTTPILIQAVQTGCGVVSANKPPFAGSYEDWKTLSRYALCRYNTTLGGPRGIPYELKTLRRGGAKIEKIEMAVNGTCNFGFHTMGRLPLHSFEMMMIESIRRGLPERDPRKDFGGDDFRNKSIIAGREAFGSNCQWAVEGEVEVTPLLPPEILGSSSEEFQSNWMGTVDDYFREMITRKALKREPGLRKHPVYMATLTPEKASVNLHHLPPYHPIIRNLFEEHIVVAVYLKGRTEPEVFKGVGAGAKDTGARVWADIIEVAQMM